MLSCIYSNLDFFLVIHCRSVNYFYPVIDRYWYTQFSTLITNNFNVHVHFFVEFQISEFFFFKVPHSNSNSSST